MEHVFDHTVTESELLPKVQTFSVVGESIVVFLTNKQNISDVCVDEDHVTRRVDSPTKPQSTAQILSRVAPLAPRGAALQTRKNQSSSESIGELMDSQQV